MGVGGPLKGPRILFVFLLLSSFIFGRVLLGPRHETRAKQKKEKAGEKKGNLAAWRDFCLFSRGSTVLSLWTVSGKQKKKRGRGMFWGGALRLEDIAFSFFFRFLFAAFCSAIGVTSFFPPTLALFMRGV